MGFNRDGTIPPHKSGYECESEVLYVFRTAAYYRRSRKSSKLLSRLLISVLDCYSGDNSIISVIGERVHASTLLTRASIVGPTFAKSLTDISLNI